MLTKPEIARAIIQGISSVREDGELQDFVVEVEGKEVKCHRLILSACSGFFRGLLRSGVNESQKQRTTLEGVSMETFAAILETLYTGSDNLTRDNMLNVWLAADQLQITFVFDNCVEFITDNICNETVISVWEVSSQLLYKHITHLCESFLKNNISMENWAVIYLTAISVGSDLMVSHVRDFIMNNYENVSKSKAFLRLRENDLFETIKSQDLVVSTEDAVVESILNWVKNKSQIISETMVEDLNDDVSSLSDGDEQNGKTEENIGELQGQNIIIFGDNVKKVTSNLDNLYENRVKYLERLLSEARLCLVSSITLEKLSRDTLVMENKRTREMVMDAALYKSVGRQHGQSLKAAVHRKCSGFKNVAVNHSKSGQFTSFSFEPNLQVASLPKCPYLVNCTSVKLIAYQTYFMAVGHLEETSSLCVFAQNEWRELITLPDKGWLGVAVEEFLYLFNSSNQQIKRFDPRLGRFLLEDLICFPTQDTIEHICSFDLFILAFCTEIIKDVDETAVHCLDVRSQTWIRLDSLEGSSKNMHSFRKEKQLYILQANGNLWEINSNEINGVRLKLVEVLWQGTSNIYGVIYIDESLCFSFGKESENDVAMSATSIFFGKIRTVSSLIDSNSLSNVVPAVVKPSARL